MRCTYGTCGPVVAGVLKAEQVVDRWGGHALCRYLHVTIAMCIVATTMWRSHMIGEIIHETSLERFSHVYTSNR